MENKSLESVFLSWAQGKEEMREAEFCALLRNCGVLDKKLTTADTELIFKKAKSKALRGIGYRNFEDAVKLCSEKKGVEFRVLVDQIISYDGPVYVYAPPRPKKTVDE